MAEASSKSDEYSSEDPVGLFAGKRALLLCRTLLGNMPLGASQPYRLTFKSFREVRGMSVSLLLLFLQIV